ncbi:DUF1275 domain-containing protein, partial [Streptomyces rubrogriseus]|nr:DUF1275 domain-containing protein [Streptomyces rubrogriseus]
RTAAVALIVAGAAAGALLCQVHEGLAVAAAACVVLAVTALGSRAAPTTTEAPATAPPTASAAALSTASAAAPSTAPAAAPPTAPSTALPRP